MHPNHYEFRYSRKKAYIRVFTAVFALMFVFLSGFLLVKGKSGIAMPLVIGMGGLGVCIYLAYRARTMLLEKNPLIVLTGDTIKILNKKNGWNDIYWHQIKSISFNRTTRDDLFSSETDATLTLRYTDAGGNTRECALNIRDLDTKSTQIYALVKNRVERGRF